MAKLTKSVLGKVSGAIGDLVFRIRSGNNFICTRPLSFMPGTDDESVERRSRFSSAAKFAGAVNSILSLRILWDKFTPNSISPFNGIFKSNYRYVTPSDILPSASLVPDLGFEIPSQTITMTAEEISVETSAIGTGTGIDTSTEKTFLMCAVIFLSDRKDENYKPMDFIRFPFPETPLDLINPLTFSHTMSDVEKQLFNRYNSAKGFFALLSLSEEGLPVHFSNTVIST